MVNKKGGKKHKKGGKKNLYNSKLLLKTEDDMRYGKVTKVLGNCRFSVLLEDGSEKLGILAGKLRKRAWVNNNSIILVSNRDFQDNKCDILHVYSDTDISQLKKIDGFPQGLLRSEEEGFNGGEDIFDYGIPEEEEEEDVYSVKQVSNISRGHVEYDIDLSDI